MLSAWRSQVQRPLFPVQIPRRDVCYLHTHAATATPPAANSSTNLSGCVLVPRHSPQTPEGKGHSGDSALARGAPTAYARARRLLGRVETCGCVLMARRCGGYCGDWHTGHATNGTCNKSRRADLVWMRQRGAFTTQRSQHNAQKQGTGQAACGWGTGAWRAGFCPRTGQRRWPGHPQTRHAAPVAPE